MKLRLLLCALFACATSLTLRAQTTYTWIGNPANGNVFNVGGNWDTTTVPTNSGTLTDLVFSTATNTNVGFNVLPYSVHKITFGNTNPAALFNINGNGNPLTLGAGGITTVAGSGGAVFNGSLSVALSAPQTWSIDANLTFNTGITSSATLDKNGSAALVLNANNSFGLLNINAGAVYLGGDNSAGSGPITIANGATLGTSQGDVTLTNAISLASGATLGGAFNGGGSSMELSGALGLNSTTQTLNIGSNSDINFSGSISASPSTALTVHSDGTGIAIMKGTVGSNVTSITADNAAIAFGNTSALTATTLQATNGGYISIADVGGTTPTMASILGKITDKTNFSGTLGFDTGDQANMPTTYTENIDLTGFTAGQVRIGSATQAILTGTITPVAQSYDFGGYAGQGGFLAVQSILADHGGATGVSVVSPSASGGAAQNGMGLILQGANSFTGNISISYSAVLLDSATAAGSGSGNFSLGNYSYIGYTDATTYTSFANFASHVTSYDSTTGTSILGIDTHDTLAAGLTGNDPSLETVRTVSDAIDLSGYSKIYLGTVSGATLTGTITAPGDGILRLVNLADLSKLTINSNLLTANGVTSVVAGLPGSQGIVVLNGTNNYTGGTSLLGGGLQVGNGNALGNGAITVGATTGGDNSSLGAASGSVTLANNIAVTDFLNIGTGTTDDSGNFTAGTTSLTLNGVISDFDGSHHGRIFITGPTTLGGANTYTSGTYVEANTTVTNNAGLGTSFVDLGYGATLTFSGAATAPTIGTLANASAFLGSSAGTGNINFGSATSLTINQTNNLPFSGQITGSGAIMKNGAAQLTLLGNNKTSYTGTVTINAGSIAIGDGGTSGATFGSNVVLNGGSLFFRPAGSETYAYGGSISGSSGGVTINGQPTGTLNVNGGGSSFTGATNVNSGTLQISADNAWSSASATTLSSGSTYALQLNNANQTFLNLNGSGKINLAASGKTLTVNTTAGSSLGGVISGAGNLAKTGSGFNLSLSGINTYTGSTTISQGGLTLTGGGSIANSSTITVASGATFTVLGAGFSLGSGKTIGGAGTVLGGTFTATSGSHISPGTGGVGSLTFNAGLTLNTGSILDFDLGSSSDEIFVTGGTFTAPSGTGGVTVNLANSGGFAAATYTLFNFASMSGLDATDFVVGTPIAGYTYNFAVNGNNLQLIATTAIPEPATSAALVGAAVLGLVAIRRRRVAA